jgi:nitrogen fixation/metabolism regulation signal transduction histidine kinase
MMEYETETALIPFVEITSDVAVGQITTNAKEALVVVKNGIARYSSPEYVPDEKSAKADRAGLNRLSKSIDDERKKIEAKYNAPIAEFLSVCKEIKTAIASAVEIVDGSVKKYEEEQKAKKYELIEIYFTKTNFGLVALDRLFDMKWLNKTCKYEDAVSELDRKIERVYSDMKAIEELSEFSAIAKSKYLDTLDLGLALAEVTRMKENQAVIAREGAERAAREIEREERLLREREAAVPEEKKAEEKVAALSAAALGAPDPAQKLVYTFAFKFTATEEKCRMLRKFMLENNIEYKKIDVCQSVESLW